MWNTILRRNSRRIAHLVAVLALIASASFVVGCNKPAEEKPKAAPEKKVEKPAPDEAQGASAEEGFSEGEQKTLTEAFAASALEEITAENADTIAAELEAELEAELAEE